MYVVTDVHMSWFVPNPIFIDYPCRTQKKNNNCSHVSCKYLPCNYSSRCQNVFLICVLDIWECLERREKLTKTRLFSYYYLGQTHIITHVLLYSWVVYKVCVFFLGDYVLIFYLALSHVDCWSNFNLKKYIES